MRHHKGNRMKSLQFTLLLILACHPALAQDCDPMATAQQAKAKTEQLMQTTRRHLMRSAWNYRKNQE